ncbi:MAG: hypothetical protein HC813_03870 [Planctomycetes bacterium]|nr:hypothetical protein [Planctomycetota bacterium]
MKAILQEAERLGRSRPVRGRIHLLLPLLILGTALALLWLSGDLGRVSAAAATSFLTVGKLIILLGAVPQNPFGMSALELGGMVFFMDALYGYFLSFNLHHVHRLRRLGPALLRLQNYCHWWLTHQPWMRRWAFTGVMLFVMFPLTGTGAPAAPSSAGSSGSRRR